MPVGLRSRGSTIRLIVPVLSVVLLSVATFASDNATCEASALRDRRLTEADYFWASL
jgi:hypothetical protein